MNTLIITLLFVSVHLNGVFGATILKISPDIEREFDSQKEKEVENLKGKEKVFSNLCLSIFNENRRQFEGSIIRLNKLDQDRVFKLTLAQSGEFVRLASILENPNIPLEEKLQESSNYTKSKLTYASNLLEITARGISEEQIKAIFSVEFIFRTLEIASDISNRREKDIRENFEETKTRIAAQDASMLGIKMESLDCSSLKEILSIKTVSKFFSENEELIKTLLSKDLQQ